MPLPVSGEETMQDKRLIHELLQHQYPALHEQLRASRRLLATLDSYATELKTHPAYWTTEFRLANPRRDPAQIANIALERAMDNIQEALRCDSPSPQAANIFFLGAAIASISRPTPSAYTPPVARPFFSRFALPPPLSPRWRNRWHPLLPPLQRRFTRIRRPRVGQGTTAR
jgi:hypothetical protein